MHRRALVLAWVLLVLASARAQPLEIVAPPDRFAAPGEYVTLVFRLTAATSVEVEVAAETERGWPVLRQAGTVRLEAGRSTPVVVTVEVPADAPAFATEFVRLRVDVGAERLERQVALTVTELLDLRVEAPREVVLGPEGLTVVAINGGNAVDTVAVELRRGSEVVQRRALTLQPGAREDVVFELKDDGSHSVVLTGERGGEVRRSVNVLRFGVAEPEPFALAADLGFGLTTSGSRFSTFTVKGALSDFATLDARVDAPSWRRSFAEVTLQHGSLRFGGGWRDPFGLGLPGAFGVAGTWSGDGWGAAAALGHVSDDRFTGAVAGSWTAGANSVAAGIGVVEGSPLVAVRAEHAVVGRKVVASAGWDRGGGSLATRAELRDDDGTIDLRAEARGLGTNRLRLDAGVRYRFGDDVLYADGGWSQFGGSAWSGRAGGAFALTADLPGTLRLGVQLGVRESFAQLGHRIDLGGGWRASQAVGARLDGDGFGVTFDALWTRSGADHLAFDARFAYRPTADRLTGRVGGRYQVELDAWTVNASAGWDVEQRAVGASAGLAWRDGAWRTEVDASVGYAWGPVAGRWNASATLTGGYAWRWPLPPAVSDAFGGRRVGAVRGRVVVVGADGPGGSEAVGLAGVIVEIGRYRVLTDEDGAFAIDLPPGRYPAAVVAATVPVAFRLLDAPRTEVEVRLREATDVVWQATRTTVLSGRVLEDRDGDGAADDPPRGVAARLLLIDAEGLRRVLVTDADGAFSARGLVPGDAELLLLDAPAGATVVGEDRRTVRLVAGENAVVEFLVQPVVVVARSFVAQALRIRGWRRRSSGCRRGGAARAGRGAGGCGRGRRRVRGRKCGAVVSRRRLGGPRERAGRRPRRGVAIHGGRAGCGRRGDASRPTRRGQRRDRGGPGQRRPRSPGRRTAPHPDGVPRRRARHGGIAVRRDAAAGRDRAGSLGGGAGGAVGRRGRHLDARRGGHHLGWPRAHRAGALPRAGAVNGCSAAMASGVADGLERDREEVGARRLAAVDPQAVVVAGGDRHEAVGRSGAEEGAPLGRRAREPQPAVERRGAGGCQQLLDPRRDRVAARRGWCDLDADEVVACGRERGPRRHGLQVHTGRVRVVERHHGARDPRRAAHDPQRQERRDRHAHVVRHRDPVLAHAVRDAGGEGAGGLVAAQRHAVGHLDPHAVLALHDGLREHQGRRGVTGSQAVVRKTV
jgi:hypothetical protein